MNLDLELFTESASKHTRGLSTTVMYLQKMTRTLLRSLLFLSPSPPLHSSPSHTNKILVNLVMCEIPFVFSVRDVELLSKLFDIYISVVITYVHTPYFSNCFIHDLVVDICLTIFSHLPPKPHHSHTHMSAFFIPHNISICYQLFSFFSLKNDCVVTYPFIHTYTHMHIPLSLLRRLVWLVHRNKTFSVMFLCIKNQN